MSTTPPDLVNGSVDYSGADSYEDISKNAWRHIIGSSNSATYVALSTLCGDKVVRNGITVHSVGSNSFIGFTSLDTTNLAVGAGSNVQFACPGARTSEIFIRTAGTRISFQAY